LEICQGLTNFDRLESTNVLVNSQIWEVLVLDLTFLFLLWVPKGLREHAALGMAGKKVSAKPSSISQEYIIDSTDEDASEASDRSNGTKASQRKQSAKAGLDESKHGKDGSVARQESSSEGEDEVETSEEEDEDQGDSDERDERGDSGSTASQSKAVAGKREAGSTHADDHRATKKAKAM